MDTRRTSELRAHEANDRIYGDHADSALVDSIAQHGIYNPLLITSDGRIIAGHRRHEAAMKLGLALVPVVVFNSDDELDIEEALIESNRQREKTNEQIGREYARLKHIYNARLSRQGNNQYADRNVASRQIYREAPHPTDQAAAAIGISRRTADHAAAVVQTIDELRDSGKKREADQLRATLNKSVNGAYTAAKESGYIAPAVKHEETPQKDSYSIAAWQALTDEQKADAMAVRSATKFNWQEENSIEWALWSWNPVTGCKHNCPYCYARDIAERFYPQKFEPTFIPGRLAAPSNTRLPTEAQTSIGHRNVFTCSMADLFGKWVPREWIDAVLETVRNAPQWNFLFLTKFPIRLSEFEFPDNAWVGTSVDCQARVKNAEDAFRNVNARVKWLSCEPMLEPLRFSDLSMFSWLVLGGSSRSTQTPEWHPPRAWINALQDEARAVGCMVYEKTNLLSRIREYPGAPVVEAVLPDELRYLASIETPRAGGQHK